MHLCEVNIRTTHLHFFTTYPCHKHSCRYRHRHMLPADVGHCTLWSGTSLPAPRTVLRRWTVPQCTWRTGPGSWTVPQCTCRSAGRPHLSAPSPVLLTPPALRSHWLPPNAVGPTSSTSHLRPSVGACALTPASPHQFQQLSILCVRRVCNSAAPSVARGKAIGNFPNARTPIAYFILW